MTSQLFLLLALASPVSGPPARDDSFFKVEAQGKWSVKLDPNGKKVMTATFTCPKFTVFGVIRVVLPAKKELEETAKKLNGQMVIVTGTARLEVEPPMGRLPGPDQFILIVETLRPAEKK